MKIRITMMYEADPEVLKQLERMGVTDRKKIQKLLEASIRLRYSGEGIKMDQLKVECIDDDLSDLADYTFLDIPQ